MHGRHTVTAETSSPVVGAGPCRPMQRRTRGSATDECDRRPQGPATMGVNTFAADNRLTSTTLPFGWRTEAATGERSSTRWRPAVTGEVTGTSRDQSYEAVNVRRQHRDQGDDQRCFAL